MPNRLPAMALKPARLAPPLRRAIGRAPPALTLSGAKVMKVWAGRASWAARSSAAIASAVVTPVVGAGVLVVGLGSAAAAGAAAALR